MPLSGVCLENVFHSNAVDCMLYSAHSGSQGQFENPKDTRTSLQIIGANPLMQTFCHIRGGCRMYNYGLTLQILGLHCILVYWGFVYYQTELYICLDLIMVGRQYLPKKKKNVFSMFCNVIDSLLTHSDTSSVLSILPTITHTHTHTHTHLPFAPSRPKGQCMSGTAVVGSP